MTAFGGTARAACWALFVVVAGAGCKPTAELEACNIAHEDCQLDIYYSLLRLRGDGIDPLGGVPPIRTLTVEEYERELRGDQPEEPPPKEEEEKKEEVPPPRKMVNSWDVALQLLGLIQPKMSSSAQSVSDRVNHVAAFYSSATRTVTVIDRGFEHNDRDDTILLTHELVHALQDDEISGWEPTSGDSEIARRMMIEGEATMYENLTALQLDMRERTDEEWQDFYKRWLMRRRRSLPNERSPYYATNWFVYPLGADRLTAAYLEGGNAAVRHVLADAPDSSGELMLFSDRAHTGKRAELSCEVGSPSRSYVLSGYDEFGALLGYAFLARAGMIETDAWTRASHVTSDRVWVFFDSTAQTVAVTWRQRYGNRYDADQVVAAISGTDKPFEAVADDGDVIVRASDVEGLVDDWAGAHDCNPSRR